MATVTICTKCRTKSCNNYKHHFNSGNLIQVDWAFEIPAKNNDKRWRKIIENPPRPRFNWYTQCAIQEGTDHKFPFKQIYAAEYRKQRLNRW